MAYKKNDEVLRDEENYYKHMYTKPGEYTSEYKDQKNAALEAYLNRGEFKYDQNADKSYQEAKKQYTKSGNKAMRDTMAQASALSGGYANSYAETVAQQQYNDYMSQLSALAPQYEENARAKWQSEGNDMLNYYQLLADAEANDYARHRDAVADYRDDRNYLYGVMNDSRTRDYNSYWDQVNYDYQQERDRVADDQWERNFAYNQERDRVADDQWRKDYEASMMSEAPTIDGVSMNPEYYEDWDASDWNIYFTRIRKEEGAATAEAWLDLFAENGLIPKNMMSVAAYSARGNTEPH
jgi:hypothetical protein